MYGQWLYQDIVYVWLVVKSRNCLYIGSGYIWTLCMNSGYIKTLFMHKKWLYEDIVYAWTVLYQDIIYAWTVVI